MEVRYVKSHTLAVRAEGGLERQYAALSPDLVECIKTLREQNRLLMAHGAGGTHGPAVSGNGSTSDR